MKEISVSGDIKMRDEDTKMNQKDAPDSFIIFNIYIKLLPYIKNHYCIVIPLAVVTILMTLFTAAIPLIIKSIFDDALGNHDSTLFIHNVIILVVGIIFLLSAWIATDVLQSAFGIYVINDIKEL